MSDSHAHFSAIVASLARPADLRTLPLPALHIVMAMRLCALFDQAGREPLVELAGRFASVTLAEQVLRLGRLVARSWPEAFTVARPCCMLLSPDERTLANAALAALSGDRDRFSHELDGFVRASRHDALYDQTALTVAGLCALQQRA